MAVSREEGRWRTVTSVKHGVPEAKKMDTGRLERLLRYWSSSVTHCVRRGDKSFARMGSMESLK